MTIILRLFSAIFCACQAQIDALTQEMVLPEKGLWVSHPLRSIPVGSFGIRYSPSVRRVFHLVRNGYLTLFAFPTRQTSVLVICERRGCGLSAGAARIGVWRFIAVSGSVHQSCFSYSTVSTGDIAVGNRRCQSRCYEPSASTGKAEKGFNW